MNLLHSHATLLAVAVFALVPTLALCGFSCRSSGSGGGDYFNALTWDGTWSHGVNPDPAIAAANPLLVSNQIPAQPGRQGDGDPHQQAALAVQDWVTATGGRVAFVILPDGDTRVPDITIRDGVPIQTTDVPLGWTQGGGVPAPDSGTRGERLIGPVTCYVSKLALPNQVRGTVRHELGHSLGLSHSPTKGDVMNPTGTPSDISGRDLRTLAKVYGVSAL